VKRLMVSSSGRFPQPQVGQRAGQQAERQRGVGVGADLAAGGHAGYHGVQRLQPRPEEPVAHAFIAAYGHDIRGWAGYPVLRDIRELSTITALLRDAHVAPAAHDRLQVRLRSLHTGGTRQWTTF
jgi:hypothetical protein